MKKLKSVVRRLIGRGGPKPVTIDSVSMTETGYCIIGWYFSQQVDQIDLVDGNGASIQSDITTVNRPDVREATGKAAKGFQMLATTRLPIDDISLHVFLRNGNTLKLKLTLKGEAMEIKDGQPVVSTSSGVVDGSCEYAIISDSHIFVIGWLMDADQHTSARLVNSAGETIADDAQVFRFLRKDVTEAFGANEKSRVAGFNILFKRTDTNDVYRRTLSVEFIVDDKPVMLPVNEKKQATDDPSQNAIRVLSSWNPTNPTHLSAAHIFQPIVTQIFSAPAEMRAHRVDFGKMPVSPKASIIIPLYGRIDFMRYQLSHFSRYPEYADCEILYVLDDPQLEQATLKLARQLEITATIGFTVLVLSQNLGFGGANNVGAENAKADTLILMNSDIMPADATWLSKMLSTCDKPDAGIVGARLLYEDDTIQHDGMAPMTLTDYPGLLFNDHPRKGWHKKLVSNSPAESECDMVTAALWAVSKADFTEAGGFDVSYALGDFEDSDLCLQMRKRGKTNYIRRDVTIYHLERQSQNLVTPGKWKHNITILNAATFNDRWSQQLKLANEVKI